MDTGAWRATIRGVTQSDTTGHTAGNRERRKKASPEPFLSQGLGGRPPGCPQAANLTPRPLALLDLWCVPGQPQRLYLPPPSPVQLLPE